MNRNEPILVAGQKISRPNEEQATVLFKKFDEILKVCEGNEHYFWSAKIISIILDCDFRDAKQELQKRNWG